MDIKGCLKKIFSWDNFFVLLGLFVFSFFIIVCSQPEFRNLLFSFLITTFIFTFLFLIVKKFRFKTAHKYTKYFLLFIFLFNFAVFISIICQISEAEKDFKSHLAYTTDVEIAKEIQKINEHIIIEKYSPKSNYKLRLNHGYASRDYIITEIAKKYACNDNILIIGCSIDYNVLAQKNWKKSLTQIISKIEGVCKANIKYYENNEIAIDVIVKKGNDKKEIERIINNLIYYKMKRKININYDN